MGLKNMKFNVYIKTLLSYINNSSLIWKLY